ncbi:hypothetical protein AAVH_32465 [Aphelenchoides avenae]|nr:hypothetical protein AAVH_32465 [Aphelenchus avenae]
MANEQGEYDGWRKLHVYYERDCSCTCYKQRVTFEDKQQTVYQIKCRRADACCRFLFWSGKPQVVVRRGDGSMLGTCRRSYLEYGLRFYADETKERPLMAMNYRSSGFGYEFPLPDTGELLSWKHSYGLKHGLKNLFGDNNKLTDSTGRTIAVYRDTPDLFSFTKEGVILVPPGTSPELLDTIVLTAVSLMHKRHGDEN